MEASIAARTELDHPGSRGCPFCLVREATGSQEFAKRGGIKRCDDSKSLSFLKVGNRLKDSGKRRSTPFEQRADVQFLHLWCVFHGRSSDSLRDIALINPDTGAKTAGWNPTGAILQATVPPH